MSSFTAFIVRAHPSGQLYTVAIVWRHPLPPCCPICAAARRRDGAFRHPCTSCAPATARARGRRASAAAAASLSACAGPLLRAGDAEKTFVVATLARLRCGAASRLHRSEQPFCAAAAATSRVEARLLLAPPARQHGTAALERTPRLAWLRYLDFTLLPRLLLPPSPLRRLSPLLPPNILLHLQYRNHGSEGVPRGRSPAAH